MVYSAPHPHHVVEDTPPSQHRHHDSVLTKWLLGAGVVTAAIIVAPLIGGVLYNAGMTSDVVGDAVAVATNACQGSAQGIAGFMGNLLSHVPLIGEGLAQGGIVNTITSAALGIGGMLAGHYIARREDGSKSIRWGNVIKTAALATSFLVASPAIFTALSMGFTFMGALAGAGTEFFTGVMNTLGTTGYLSTGAAGLGVIGAHLFSCGPAILGVAAAAESHQILNKLDEKYRAGHVTHASHAHDVPPGESTHRIKILGADT